CATDSMGSGIDYW
nr:immunoglobulin heavy chain junction region [Macaca mulatta]MOV36663.1 immunoglobulin heavy chain junction region [Macaca mulatta]